MSPLWAISHLDDQHPTISSAQVYALPQSRNQLHLCSWSEIHKIYYMIVRWISLWDIFYCNNLHLNFSIIYKSWKMYLSLEDDLKLKQSARYFYYESKWQLLSFCLCFDCWVSFIASSYSHTYTSYTSSCQTFSTSLHPHCHTTKYARSLALEGFF